jgi:serine/threonine-protein kinase
MLDSPEPPDAPEEGAEATVMLDSSVASESAVVAAEDAESPLFADTDQDLSVDEEAGSDLTVDPRMPTVGELLADRYELVGILGQGGFAVVFEAVDTTVSGDVAVKVLQAEKSAEEDFAKRFRQEVKMVRHLKHPNTIKVYDTGTTERGCLYMVMEFVRGKELEEYLRTTGAMDPARTLHLGEQILKSLSEAHKQGIIHRDLKPANIMITTMGGDDEVVKVLDFGIAKALRVDLAEAKTETGIVFCTPKYAAPEVLLGSDNIGPAADVYSLGLILIEMLTGHQVYSVGSDAEAIAAQLSPQPAPIPAEVVETAFGEILQKASAKSLEERYADAGEMLADLKKLHQYELPTAPITLSAESTAALAAGSYDDTFIFSKQQPQVPSYNEWTQTLAMGGGAAAGSTTTIVTTQSRGSSLALGVALIAILMAIGAVVIWFVGQNQETDDGTDGQADLVAPEAVEDEDEVFRGRGASSREILSARLAASDWETGSWLDIDDAPADPSTDRESPPTTRPDRVEEPPVALLDRGEGAGQDATGVLALVDGSLDEEQATLTWESEAQRLRLLYESVQANDEAYAILENALNEDQIPLDQRAQAQTQLLSITESMVAVLLELDRCDTAERRLDSSLDRTGLDLGMPPPAVRGMRADINSCRERRTIASEEWTPQEYVSLVRNGDRVYSQALEFPGEDQRRRALLYQSVHVRQRAIDMLREALESERIPVAHRASASRDLAQLSDEVLATLMDLELTVAVDIRIAEMLQDVDLLPDDAAADIVLIASAVEVEQIEGADAGSQERAREREERRRQRPSFQALGDVGPSEGSGAGVALVEEGTGAGTGQGAYEGTGAMVASMEPIYDFDFTEFNNLVSAGGQLLEEAQDLEFELASQTASEEPVLPPGFVMGPDGVPIPEGTGEVVDEGPTVYSITLDLESDPTRCRVVMNGEVIGRTPFNGVIESEDERVRITLRKSNFEPLRVTVPMTEGDYATAVRLEPRNPFGQTGTLADQRRRRSGQ